jgi:hypothetical protein
VGSRKDFFLRIARSMFTGDIGHVAEWFREDFKLHGPSIGGFRSSHDGARGMLRSLAEHVPCARIDVLDMVEEGNKVTVRWLFSGKKYGRPVYLGSPHGLSKIVRQRSMLVSKALRREIDEGLDPRNSGNSSAEAEAGSEYPVE